MSSTYRCTFTLPIDQATILANCSQRLACSQSAVLSVLLEQLLPQLSVGLATVDPPTGGPRRLVGDSAVDIRDEILAALRAANQFPDLFGCPQ